MTPEIKRRAQEILDEAIAESGGPSLRYRVAPREWPYTDPQHGLDIVERAERNLARRGVTKPGYEQLSAEYAVVGRELGYDEPPPDEPSDEERREERVHAAALRLLGTDDYSSDDYIAAYAAAERTLGVAYRKETQ